MLRSDSEYRTWSISKTQLDAALNQFIPNIYEINPFDKTVGGLRP